MRYVIEGEWLGYRSSQDHIVHREVASLKYAQRVMQIGYAITFTDGTSLRLTVRPANPREKVKPINGYGSLIRDCAWYGVNSVDGLTKIRKIKEADAEARRNPPATELPTFPGPSRAGGSESEANAPEKKTGDPR